MMLFESVKCVGKKVVFEFKTEYDAKLFKELFESPKTSPKGAKSTYLKVEQHGRWVAVFYATEKEAQYKAAKSEYPRDCVILQRGRCKTCD